MWWITPPQETFNESVEEASNDALFSSTTSTIKSNQKAFNHASIVSPVEPEVLNYIKEISIIQYDIDSYISCNQS